MVVTHAMPDTLSLMQQRKRWVSKSTSYQARIITLLMALVYLYNLSIPLTGILALWQPPYAAYFWMLLLLKTTVEGVFLWRVLRTFNREHLIWYIGIAEPLHIAYVLYVGIAGLTGSYEWKGRQVT